MNWINYFVHSKKAFGHEGHLPADELRARIESHHGGEAFHCAFDLEQELLKIEDGKQTNKDYVGPMRPAMGYVWFDFDSHDGGVQAWKDLEEFKNWLGVKGFGCYSGSKGFHYGIPFSCFGLAPDAALGAKLNALATELKKRFPSIDTTVFNANRKFRALGTKHPSTGLYKIWLGDCPGGEKPTDLELIKKVARSRGSLKIPEAPTYEPLKQLTDLLKGPALQKGDSIGLDELRRYRQPQGEEAFKQCAFLNHARTNPNEINEPQWYAAASIVGRFKDGQAQFHAMSKGHRSYNATHTDEKLQQALQVSGPRTCEAIGKLWDGCKDCALFQKITSPIVILEKDVIATEATGFYDLIRNGDEIKRVPNYNDLLRKFVLVTPYRTIADMKCVYVYNGKHYEEHTPIEIKSFAEDQFNPKPTEKLRQEFTHKVFANRVARRTFFSLGTENRINFDNGILSITDATLSPHSPDFGFRNALPYNFDLNAKCPTFEWWINDVMLGDRQLIEVLQEFMGYVVRGGEYSHHKALWLSGTGRNGKSTFLSVLKALIGTGNYSTLSIRQIINDKFSSADLDGKIANFSEETSPEELSDSGPFKNLTGDGELLAQKKYGDPYSFRNRAKMIMTYNEVPQLKDLSPGMLSRPIIVPWKKDLTQAGSQDKTLKQKLLSELPGIFNFALRGWKRLDEQGEFTQSPKSAIEMEEMRQASCSAAAWVAENITFCGPDVDVTKPRQLYEAYKLAVGQYAFSEQRFYKRLNAIPNVAKRRTRSEKGIEYIGMKFRRNSVLGAEF